MGWISIVDVEIKDPMTHDEKNKIKTMMKCISLKWGKNPIFFFFLIMSSLSEIAKVTNSGGEVAIFEVISYLILLRMLLF